jgi:hypothetical protein
MSRASHLAVTGGSITIGHEPGDNRKRTYLGRKKQKRNQVENACAAYGKGKSRISVTVAGASKQSWLHLECDDTVHL